MLGKLPELLNSDLAGALSNGRVTSPRKWEESHNVAMKITVLKSIATPPDCCSPRKLRDKNHPSEEPYNPSLVPQTYHDVGISSRDSHLMNITETCRCPVRSCTVRSGRNTREPLPCGEDSTDSKRWFTNFGFLTDFSFLDWRECRPQSLHKDPETHAPGEMQTLWVTRLKLGQVDPVD